MDRTARTRSHRIRRIARSSRCAPRPDKIHNAAICKTEHDWRNIIAGHIASAQNTNWCTEQRVVDLVREAFGGVIALDPCSNSESVVAAEAEFLLPDHDGLEEEWSPRTNYVNPPFGRSYMHQACKTICFTRRTTRKTKAGKKKEVTEFICPRCECVFDRKEVKGSSIADWVRKMLGTHRQLGAEVIGLIPAAVGTAHFQQYVWKNADAVCFPEGRLSFEGKPSEGKKAEVAPMDVCLPYWGSNPDRFDRVFASLGHVDRLDIARGDRFHQRAA